MCCWDNTEDDDWRLDDGDRGLELVGASVDDESSGFPICVICGEFRDGEYGDRACRNVGGRIGPPNKDRIFMY